MQFQTLEKQDLNTLCDLFNEAFSDYFVKIELAYDVFKNKVHSEDIDLTLSVGAFDGKRPVGFILHAIRNGIIYNGGTGVIPEARGNHLTLKMYEFILPKLRAKGAREVLLEVIDVNVQAIKSYGKVGFVKLVDLNCYKGNPAGRPINLDIDIKKVSTPDFNLFQSFWEWEPTWQHASLTLDKLNDYTCFGAFKKDQLVGYAFILLQKGRVAQFAVHPEYRKMGIAFTLFHYIKQQTESELYVMNVDGSHMETNLFLQSVGMQHFTTQHKMKLTL